MAHDLMDTSYFHYEFQDLYSTRSWQKVGVEALLRSEKVEPKQVFEEARNLGKLYEFETKLISKLLQTFSLEGPLFIRIHSTTILNREFPFFIQRIAKNFFKKTKIVFEIVEAEDIENIALFKERIALLKKLGFCIAIVNVGKNWPTLQVIIKLKPHIIKLNEYYSQDLSNNNTKQTMIKSFIDYAKNTNSLVVLEGIQTHCDLAMAKFLGIDICQGCILDEPKPIMNLDILE